MNKKFVLVLVILIMCGVGIPLVMQISAATDKSNQLSSSPSQQTNTSSPWSLTVVVNKRRPLNPTDYIPVGLEAPAVALRLDNSSEEMKLIPEARAGLQQMFITANGEGVKLMLASGYRSYAAQAKLHDFYVSKQGQVEADKQSARAGYSEHQTGMAADVTAVNGKCSIQACFADTPEGKWVAAHAHEYGFIIRYPADMHAITGYDYEPWHLRFVGTEEARAIRDSGKTMEEYYGLAAAADYQ